MFKLQLYIYIQHADIESNSQYTKFFDKHFEVNIEDMKMIQLNLINRQFNFMYSYS